MAIPYGYKVVKGKAVIDEVEAEQVRMVFKGYLSGLAYVVAAEAVGLKLTHPSVKMILQNKRYLGDKYYPAIIDQETFDKAEAERFKRQRQMGRIFPDKPVTKKPAEVRMGKGKGAPELFVARISPGRILFEAEGVPMAVAKEALRLAAQKLPVTTSFVVRRDYTEETI